METLSTTRYKRVWLARDPYTLALGPVDRYTNVSAILDAGSQLKGLFLVVLYDERDLCCVREVCAAGEGVRRGKTNIFLLLFFAFARLTG